MLRVLRVLLLLLICCLGIPALAEQADISHLYEQIETARQQGDMDKADELAQRYLQWANEQEDNVARGKAYLNLGKNAMERNNYPDAKTHLQQAIRLFRDTKQSLPLANALNELGLTFRYQSQYAPALDYLNQAMQIYQTEQAPLAIASAYSNIALTLEQLGQYDEALQAHLNALELSKQEGDQDGIASAIYNMGELHHVMGDSKKALDYFLQALELDEASGNPKNIAYSHNKLGFMYSASGDFAKSSSHLNKALALFEQIHAPRDADWARTNLAKLAMEKGQYDDAKKLLDGIISRAIEQNFKSLLVDAYRLATELSIKTENYAAALNYIDAGVIQARLNNERPDEAELEQFRVEVFIKQDSIREALAALQRQKKLDDDIFNTARAATIANIQAQAEFTRQQNQIELLKKEQALQQSQAQQHKIARNFWILGLGSGFVLLIMLYHRHNQKRLNTHLVKEVSARTLELKKKNEELLQAYEKLEDISLTDKLTGLHNRHFLEKHIEGDLSHIRRLYQDWRSGKTPQPQNADLVLFLIDLDKFKALNDTYGHNTGDEVLTLLKQRMQQVFRTSDYLVRWGGEEFVAVARFIDREDAKNLAQRFIYTVQNLPFEVKGHAPLHVTCSVGYACYPLSMGEPGNHWKVLLELADACLYAAKHSGRNGWVGMHSYMADLPLTTTNISASQMQNWLKQNQITVEHSFSGQLQWQKS